MAKARASEGGSRLQAIFANASHAIGEGRLQAAFRFLDCALRIAPDDATCLLMYARLITKLGREREAVERLQKRHEPELLLARSEALCALGEFEAACEICQDLLSQYAVNSLESLPSLLAQLCSSSAVRLPGWIGVETDLRLIGQVRARTAPRIQSGDHEFEPTVSQGDACGLSWFWVRLPPGFSGRLRVSTSQFELLGSGLTWPPEFGLSGWVLVENRKLVGEAQLNWAPGLRVGLAISCENREKRVEMWPSGPSATPQFSLPLDLGEQDAVRLEVSAVLPDGSRQPLVGSPVSALPTRAIQVKALPKRSSPAGLTKERNPREIIDIVVPVYAGREQTLECLESVLNTTRPQEAELVVVNDRSPDLQLVEDLDRLARRGRITLLTNHSNQGFPSAANRGISLHPSRDVVLLNADTQLFGDWLDRLKLAAYSDDDIGTVTPLGESASIATYPGKLDRVLSEPEAAAIDRIAGSVNSQRMVDLPVGVGFCLYMKRACLTQVGVFDESTFDKGYGEENDFCLRARSLGWRHVAATNLFVRHRGAQSFRGRKSILTERNRRVLNALHPGYEALVADFVAADPLLEARRAIDAERLLKETVDPVLLVTFDLPGGVKRHVDARIAELLERGSRTVIVLRPSGTADRPEQIILDAQVPELQSLLFTLPREAASLAGLLTKLQLSNIELHHFVGLPSIVLDLVTALGIGYDLYVHDYSWVCPRMTLLGGNDVYCGEPPIEECERCIQKHGSAFEPSLTVEALRARSSRILNAARAVIVPSHDVRRRLLRYFPGLRIRVTPWEKSWEVATRFNPPAAGRVRVGVIGAISIAKGYRVLLDCARDAEKRDLALEFVVIGFTSNDEQLLATERVFITGPYVETEVRTLLEREQCHVAFFPSVVPETWCYALSHALAYGLPTAAFDFGAIAERSRAHGTPLMLPLSASAAAINDALLGLARRNTISYPRKELFMDSTAPPNTGSSPELAASVQLLTLPAGTYTLNVRGTPAPQASAELMLPGMQVGLAPVRAPGDVEFLARDGTADRWLSRSSDMIIARIFGESAALMLTSVRSPDSPALAIDVRRLGTESWVASPEPRADEATSSDAHTAAPAQILAHIQNLGDIPFTDGLAGCIGGRLWIEAFAIGSVGPLTPDWIEYCGVTADGFQTPWLGNQVLCGSRGRSIPLMGFAVRLKSEIAAQYDCTYTGRFVSGVVLGPCKNGDLCCSNVPRDPLWGLELAVTLRSQSEPQGPRPEAQFSNAA